MRKVKISIRYKFLMLISALLVLCVIAYLGLATHVFTKDKKQLVFAYNQSFVANISSETEKLLDSVSSKMRLAAMLYFENKKSKLLDQLFREEEEIAYFAISEDFKNLQAQVFWNENFFKTYGVDEKSFSLEMDKSLPFPWEKIKETGSYVWRPKSFENIPVLFFSKVVFIEGEKSQVLKNLVVTSLVRLDRLSKNLFNNSLVQIDIFNKDYQSVFSKSSRKDPIVDLLIDLKKQTQRESIQAGVFELKAKEDRYLAAYAKSLDSNLIVFSTVSSEQAFSVVDSFLLRSILFASIVITLAFIVAILFSRSLTRPLDTLMEAMAKVAKGDLSIKIRLKTKDETRVLAESFNQMISDLEKSQNKLVEINRELENKVKERTRKLEEQNIAVKDAQEALLRTSRLAAAGEIAGRAAHEVLNPLTSILTRSQLIIDRLNKRKQDMQSFDDIHSAWLQDLDKGKEYLIESWLKSSSLRPDVSLLQEDIDNIGSIKESMKSEISSVKMDAEFLLEEAFRINKIVQSMRSLNRSASDIRPYFVKDLIHDSINIMADAANKQATELSLDETANIDQVMIEVDRDEFLQSVTNLIRNSLQAVSLIDIPNFQSKINFEFSLQGDLVIIDIKDNGVGISKENQDKLFESNFSTKDKETGTGLGLSISRRFLRSFQGDLMLVTSHLGEGSHFRLELPMMATKPDAKESA